LIGESADGFCVTKYVANKLAEFINSSYPEELHVGPVLSSGEDSVNEKLGYKKAAPSLRVPRKRDPSELDPCF
jgi:hypothetical protein